MARTVATGIQNFDEIIEKNCFYIDKTAFIKKWWESGDSVTLIARPRRFGKTLNMSMLEHFFSVRYADKRSLFEGLSIWREEKYRQMQGTYPVISLSFAKVKGTSFADARREICQIIKRLYKGYGFLLEGGCLDAEEKEAYRKISVEMENYIFADSLNILSEYLSRYYGRKVIILLDEYDTPLQEAYVGGYWREMVDFLKGFFNATFKTNPYLDRALMTGITRVSKESIFSDLNHLRVVTATSDKYATSFGFTEDEVFAALEEYGFSGMKGQVKYCYDGFAFGKHRDIYNPWSILSFLQTGEVDAYWANTSSNDLVAKLLQEGDRRIKEQFEALLQGESIRVPVDEQIVYSRLDRNATAIWSLLLATGYLKVLDREPVDLTEASRKPLYELTITNYEVQRMFNDMVADWFSGAEADYGDFVKALLLGNLEAMNDYMNSVALKTFSYFDTGTEASEAEPERFYHGFVLGLMVKLSDKYAITSNRESGFGRYDVVIEPKTPGADAMILEFKVRSPRREASLEDTVESALRQIQEKQYAADLIAHGIPAERIRSYGFAFEGKRVLIGGGEADGSRSCF